MRFMWNKPVFLTMLSLGSFSLVFLLVVGMSFKLSIFLSILSIIIGIVIGAVVALVEVRNHKQKQTDLYHPTQTPYNVQAIIMACAIFIHSLRFWIAIVLATYVLTLAFVFRKYEVSLGKSGIKWNELFPEKNTRSSSEEKIDK